VPIPAHLIDTNILLRIARRDDPDHAVADAALVKLAENMGCSPLHASEYS
jgi:hypothetical protein